MCTRTHHNNSIRGSFHVLRENFSATGALSAYFCCFSNGIVEMETAINVFKINYIKKLNYLRNMYSEILAY